MSVQPQSESYSLSLQGDGVYRSISTVSVIGLALIVTAIAVAAGLTFYFFSVDRQSYAVSATLVVSASLTLVLPVVTAMTYRPYDIFHPLNFVALSLFFGVFGRVLFVLSSDSPSVGELLDGRGVASLLPGAFLSLVGTCCICAGFAVGTNWTFRPVMLDNVISSLSLQRLSLWLPLVFILCAITTILFIKQTGAEFSGIENVSAKRRVVIDDVESSLGYYRLVAQDVPRAILLILVAAWCALSKSRKWILLAIGAFSVLAIALPFVSSSRSQVLIALIAVCVTINRVRVIRLPVLLFVFLISILIIFGMLALRRTGSRNQSFSESIVTMGLEPLFGNHSFSDIAKLSHIDEAVPELISYKYGKSFINVLFAPVPRTLWPGKPPISMGREITEKIYNRGLALKDKGGGTPPGLFGESIINFGRVGFPFVVVFAGMLLGWLNNTLGFLASRSVAGVALYGGVMPAFCLSMMGGDFSRSLIQGLSTLAIIVGICCLTRLRLPGLA